MISGPLAVISPTPRTFYFMLALLLLSVLGTLGVALRRKKAAAFLPPAAAPAGLRR